MEGFSTSRYAMQELCKSIQAQGKTCILTKPQAGIGNRLEYLPEVEGHSSMIPFASLKTQLLFNPQLVRVVATTTWSLNPCQPMPNRWVWAGYEQVPVGGNKKVAKKAATAPLSSNCLFAVRFVLNLLNQFDRLWTLFGCHLCAMLCHRKRMLEAHSPSRKNSTNQCRIFETQM